MSIKHLWFLWSSVLGLCLKHTSFSIKHRLEGAIGTCIFPRTGAFWTKWFFHPFWPTLAFGSQKMEQLMTMKAEKETKLIIWPKYTELNVSFFLEKLLFETYSHSFKKNVFFLKKCSDFRITALLLLQMRLVHDLHQVNKPACGIQSFRARGPLGIGCWTALWGRDRRRPPANACSWSTIIRRDVKGQHKTHTGMCYQQQSGTTNHGNFFCFSQLT